MTWNPGPNYVPRPEDWPPDLDAWAPERPASVPEPPTEASLPETFHPEPEGGNWTAPSEQFDGYGPAAGEADVRGAPLRTTPRLGRGVKLLLAALGVLVVLVIVAIIAIPRVLYGGNPADRQLTVTGSQSAWMNNGYLAGFRAVDLGAGTLVAVSESGSVAVTSQTMLEEQRTVLRGYSLPDGAEIWSREGLSCSVYSALGDTLHCFGLTPMDTKLYLVDMATGEDRTIELSVQPSSLEVVGSDASLLISRVSIETGGVLFSVPVADGAQAWSTPIPASMTRCELLSGAVGCRTSTGDRFMILDATTGAIRVPETALAGDLALLNWLSDGFSITQAGSGMDARNQVQLFDLDANPVETVRHAAVPGFPDGLRGRAHYSLADLQARGDVVLVDGEGNVVASRPRPGSDVRYQPGNERVDEGALPQAVSADGSVVLEWINLSSWRLVDRSGTELQTIDTTSQVVVSNGFLAYDKPNGGVTVLVPGA